MTILTGGDVPVLEDLDIDAMRGNIGAGLLRIFYPDGSTRDVRQNPADDTMTLPALYEEM